MSVYDKLKELNITLPSLTAPAAVFVPFVITGNQIFTSGHIARKDGKSWVGKLGSTVTTEQGKEAARGIAIELLSTLHAATGDLNKIKRIVKLLVLVKGSPGKFGSGKYCRRFFATGSKRLGQMTFGVFPSQPMN